MFPSKLSQIENLFAGRRLVIGTKHDKQTVIAPVIEKIIGVTCFVSRSFDTDSLGTFSGEIERQDDPITTVRKKCLAAMNATQCDMGIASEGSFGTHPASFLLPADDELLIFIDSKNGIEVTARTLTTATNFRTRQITNEKQLLDFAEEAGFPSHGLILRKSKQDHSGLIKGITNIETLQVHYYALQKAYGEVFAETDMRANFNPTRMQVIAGLTQKLADNIVSCCPRCDMPGFNIAEALKGLPCAECYAPTQSILSHIYICKHCFHTEEKMYPGNKKFSEPLYCDHCNP